MKNILSFVFCCTVFQIFANAGMAEGNNFSINYETMVNGEVIPRGGQTKLIAGSNKSKSYAIDSGAELIPQTPKETNYIDFEEEITYQLADLYNGKRIYTETPFSEFPEITETSESDTILGYLCKKVKATLRSNSIEIWYTTELGT